MNTTLGTPFAHGNNTTANDNFLTSPGQPDPLLSRELWYWMVRGLIAIVTIFGNGFVIYLISTRIVLREQASPNWFVLSMAVADFCVGFVNFPLNVFYAFTQNASDNLSLWSFLSLVQNVFLNSSVTNLLLLTLDRNLAVVHPFIYETFMTPSKVLLLIALAWGLATLIELPYLYLDLQGRAVVDPESYLVVMIIYMILMVFLPSFYMIYAYGQIIWVARKHKKKIKQHRRQLTSNSSVRRRMTQNGNKNGAMVTVGTIVLIFLLSNLFTEYRCVCYLLLECKESLEGGYAFLFLRNLNSAPNFIVYAFMKKDFRRELRKTIRRHFRQL